MKAKGLLRQDENQLILPNEAGVPVAIFANARVLIEEEAVEDLRRLLRLGEEIKKLRSAAGALIGDDACLRRVVVTPDFHKGSRIPIGTVLATEKFFVPQAIGNDVNCGMRLYATGYRREAIAGKFDQLETVCRHMFFEGGRDIPMNRKMREALLRDGLAGLAQSVPREFTQGLWRHFHAAVAADELARVSDGGSFVAGQVVGLDKFMGDERLSRDAQIGSIGGGNHFVEIQAVKKIYDAAAAYAWGLRVGQIVVMAHSGSLMLGHHAGSVALETLQQMYPRQMIKPANGIYILAEERLVDADGRKVQDVIYNAANFAFANRMFLGLMAKEALRRVCGDGEFALVYDAPHNMFWREKVEGKEAFVHRKGACPAHSAEQASGEFQDFGEPVLVPGSMGSSSFVLHGLGNEEALMSASHGAGRRLSRGDAMKHDPAEFDAFLKKFRVVTPVDFRRADIRQRRDIIAKKLADLKQEAPFAYKGIGPVIDTLIGAGIALPVAELEPIMTIKG